MEATCSQTHSLFAPASAFSGSRSARRSSATAAMSPSRWPKSPSHGKYSRRFYGSSRNYGRSQRQPETFEGHAFKSNRRQECVRMPGKMARSDPRTSLEHHSDAWNARAIHTSHLGFQPVLKRPTIHASSGGIWGIPAKFAMPCINERTHQGRSHGFVHAERQAGFGRC